MQPKKPKVSAADVLAHFNDDTPFDVGGVQWVVIVNDVRTNGYPVGRIFLVDKRTETEVTIPPSQGRRLRPMGFGSETRWVTEDRQAAKALSAFVKEPHSSGTYEYRDDKWQIVDLAGAKRLPPSALRLKR